MKNYFSILSIVLGIILTTAPAFAINTFDLNQFEQYCPSVNALTFTARRPGGAGVITGTQNTVNFTSTSPSETAPQKLIDNIIQGVQPSDRNGIYGYQSGNQITCFYLYTNFLNTPVYLIMQGMTTD